jgi:hypothetical protein
MVRRGRSVAGAYLRLVGIWSAVRHGHDPSCVELPLAHESDQNEVLTRNVWRISSGKGAPHIDCPPLPVPGCVNEHEDKGRGNPPDVPFGSPPWIMNVLMFRWKMVLS